MSRQLLLRELIASRFGGSQKDFAAAVGRSPAQINQWLTGHRKIGDAGARNIEIKLGLAAGYFDRKISYAKTGNILALQIGEPSETDDIERVVALMRATDAKGRSMALAAVKVALAGHVPDAHKNGTVL